MSKQTGYFEIKDKILYHTTRGRNFNVGDVLNFGNEPNGMYKRVIDGDYTLNGETFYDESHHTKKLKKYCLVSGKKVNALYRIINNYDFAIRELALEDIRKHNFPKYPSRFKSLFVCDTLEDALVWFPLIGYKQQDTKLLKLKCTGKLFVGDSRVNRKDNNSYARQLEQSLKYWQGEQTSSPRFECLFEGTAEVVEVVKEIK